MPAIEAVTALYLASAEPSLTSLGSRIAQRRERIWGRSDFAPSSTTYRALPEFDLSPTVRELPDFSMSPLSQADRVIFSLQRFEKLTADWDGNGGEQPSLVSIRDARDFIRSLAPESAIPRATLHADGHVILFLRAANSYAELEFLGNRKIGYYARRGQQEWSDEIEFLGQALPRGLSDVGFIVSPENASAAA
jgi:hypothetical protein